MGLQTLRVSCADFLMLAEMTHLCTDSQHLEMVLDLFEKGQLSNLSTVISLDAASTLHIVNSICQVVCGPIRNFVLEIASCACGGN